MRKKLIILFCAIFCIFCVLFVLYTLNRVTTEIGESDRFTQEEIALAMDIVKKSFEDRFGWRDRLVSLSYYEAFSESLLIANGLDVDNTIIIMSYYHQPVYGLLGHGWTLSREGATEPWILISGPFPGNMGH